MKKALIVSIIVAAELMLFASTYPHIGADPDSTVYVGVAKNWLAGQGLTMPVIGGPMTHYPPLYALILSVSGLFGINMLRWALWLDTIILAANILLAVHMARRMGLENTALPTALIALSPGILTVHWMVWSEPLLLFLAFAGLVLVDIYLQNGRTPVLMLAGLVMALAWLDRYAGVALIAGLCGGLWLFSRRKVRDVLMFGFISVAPMLLWMAYNTLHYANPINRNLAFRPLTPLEGVELVLEMVLLGALYLLVRHKKAGTMHHLLVLCMFGYAAVLAVTVCLVDAATPVFDTRIQVPVMFAGFLLLPWLARLLQPRTAKLFSALLIFLVFAQLAGSLVYTSIGYFHGLPVSDGTWIQENQSIPAHPWQ